MSQYDKRNYNTQIAHDDPSFTRVKDSQSLALALMHTRGDAPALAAMTYLTVSTLLIECPLKELVWNVKSEAEPKEEPADARIRV